MEPETRGDWQEDEVNLLRFWRVTRRHGWLLVGLIVASALVAGIWSQYFAVKIYESKATILPPREVGGAGGGLVAALGGSGLRQLLEGIVTSSAGNRDTFVAILKSRTVAQDILERFDLKGRYAVGYTEEAMKILEKRTDVRISKEGVISVAVEDENPKLAADIANFYVFDLDRLFSRLGTTAASRQRAFIADRLVDTDKTLRQAEETVRRFQESNRTVVIQDQAKNAIEEAAKLKGQILTAEGQLEFMRTYSTESNPQVIAQKRQIEEMKRQLAQMQYGQGMDLPAESANPGQPRKEFQVPFTKVPELGMELARLTREMKTQETVYGLLTAQFEQAKIAEARDTPVVQVLDKAIPAERKKRPIVTLNIAIAAAVSLFFGVLLVHLLDYLEYVRRGPASAQQVKAGE
jgi:tyrosine-protein kinase Etk/Wzc